MEHLSLLLFFIFFCSLSIKKLFLVFGIAALVCLFSAFMKRNGSPVTKSKSIFFLVFAVLLLGMRAFYTQWSPSRKIAALSSSLHLTKTAFLVILCVAIATLSFYGVYLFFLRLTSYRGFRKSANRYANLIQAILFNVVLLLPVYQLQRSSLDPFGDIFKIKIWFLVVNYALVLILDLLMIVISGKTRVGLAIGSTIFTVLAIVNFYVITYHADPLFPNEFANAGTALNVLGEYHLSISPQIVDVIAFYLLELYFIQKIENHPERCLKRVIVLIIDASMLGFLLWSPYASQLAAHWSWKLSIAEQGYLCCFIGDLKNVIYPVKIPEEYDSSAIVIPEVQKSEPQDLPDIIFILDETFCDLSYYSDTPSDVDYLSSFYSIENAYYGYAFTPSIGGGTNKSEFELLTSNSLYLLNGGVPFNFIDFHTFTNTFLSYLHHFGYTTTAMHCMPGSNYNRDKAYPAMGFDHVYLGENSFSEMNHYGNRIFLDEDNYNGMLSLMENSDDSPGFYYLLTFQNHGGWEQNDSELDTVHMLRDAGGLTEVVNEYMTSAAMSADAIRHLITELSDYDRQVIVCMVGDHSPVFINQLTPKKEMNNIEADVAQRAVPYLIWANYELNDDALSPLCSMTDLVPMILSASDLPLTPFFQEILNIQKVLPVRTRSGYYIDFEGKIGSISENEEYSKLLEQYYFMEYNGIHHGEDYISKLFEINQAP